MKIVMMAAAAALLAVPAMAQDAASPENLVLPGATLAPDCGADLAGDVAVADPARAGDRAPQ